MENNIKITIEKCSIPIIWLDTSIIINMAKYKYQIGQIDNTTYERSQFLYNNIYKYSRKSKIICPLAGQKNEIWVDRDKWLDTIHTLSLGIETLSIQNIIDYQFNSFLNAYINNSNEIFLSYKKIFHKDPIIEINEVLSNPFYITVSTPILGRADCFKKSNKELLDALNTQRELNVKNGITFDDQIEEEYMGELLAFYSFSRNLLLNNNLNEEDQFNALIGIMGFTKRLKYLMQLTGKENDYDTLRNFYKSSYYKEMPSTNIKCNFMARLMIDKQKIRSGDVMDSDHASTILPFCDLFITDNAMSTFLNQKKYNKKYNSVICYIGDLEKITDFFSKL